MFRRVIDFHPLRNRLNLVSTIDPQNIHSSKMITRLSKYIIFDNFFLQKPGTVIDKTAS